MEALQGSPPGKLPVVPTGLFVFRIFDPGLRPGLSSAVPTGLSLQSVLTDTLVQGQFG